jgi:hypothetical protein
MAVFLKADSPADAGKPAAGFHGTAVLSVRSVPMND